MTAKLKPLSEQVIVVTGATSGHGLCTARLAAKRGAKVMLAARDERALEQACREIEQGGGTAAFVVTDVARPEQVQRLADETIARFGRFDSWVNNAGIGIYGRVLELATEDHRQLFETNYWGTVHGTIVAARYLKGRPGGGAVINVGSINSDLPGPLMAAYNASKHAIKGFTDSLRIELMMDRLPVSITLIEPSAIGTPFPDHARNVTGYRARLPRPIYAPEVVARAILDAAQHPRRTVIVGGAGRFQILGMRLLPHLFDRIAVRMAGKLVEQDQPVPEQPGNLYAPQGDDGRADGRQRGRSFSLFTAAGRHGWSGLGAAAALGAAGAWAVLRHRARG